VTDRDRDRERERERQRQRQRQRDRDRDRDRRERERERERETEREMSSNTSEHRITGQGISVRKLNIDPTDFEFVACSTEFAHQDNSSSTFFLELIWKVNQGGK
jgi:hypothetical protein